MPPQGPRDPDPGAGRSRRSRRDQASAGARGSGTKQDGPPGGPLDRGIALRVLLWAGVALALAVLAWQVARPPQDGPGAGPDPGAPRNWGLGLDLNETPTPAPLPEDPADLRRLAGFLPGFRRASQAACGLPVEGTVSFEPNADLLLALDTAVSLCSAQPEVARLSDQARANRTRQVELVDEALRLAGVFQQRARDAIDRVEPGSYLDAEVLAEAQDRFLFGSFLLRQAHHDRAAWANGTFAALDPVFANAAWSAALSNSTQRLVATFPWKAGHCSMDLEPLAARARGRLERSLELAAASGSRDTSSYYGMHGSLVNRIGPRLQEATERGWWPEVARLDMELGWTQATWENLTLRPLPEVAEAHLLEARFESRLRTLTTHYLVQSYTAPPLTFEVEWQRDPMQAIHVLAIGGLKDSFAAVTCSP